MCGIVAATAQRDIVPILLAGLHALEYRGYDSAGFCIADENGLKRLRTVGKVAKLDQLQQEEKLSSPVGIAHTRWATHGKPSTRNAHPMLSLPRIGVVHNGIIENHDALREELKAAGYTFDSETDTEVVAHLIDHHMSQGASFAQAFREAAQRLEGGYAIAAVCADDTSTIMGTRQGCPLVLGLGFDEHFLASDIHALLPVTNRFIYLKEGDVAQISASGYQIVDKTGQSVERSVTESKLSAEELDRGEYRHYMLKEIFEQPEVLAETLEGRIVNGKLLDHALGQNAEALLQKTKSIQIIACGTSYHAGLVARYWIESIAGIPCQVEVASEFRYRDTVAMPDCLFLTISQSGETADTLAALQKAKEQGSYVGSLCICNVPESSLVRESDCTIMTRGGLEIGVASTKAFTTQLAVLAMITVSLARIQGKDIDALTKQLDGLAQAVQSALELNDRIADLAKNFGPKHHTLFLGRGWHYPIALEGALKLKEISYIHAEAYPAGELKHGPLALVDEEMPVIAVAPGNALLEKLKSNIQEVQARGGELYVVVDEQSASQKWDAEHTLKVPHVGEFISPIVMTVPLQLLSYHVALIKGTDVDQPRNLAKSVTVE